MERLRTRREQETRMTCRRSVGGEDGWMGGQRAESPTEPLCCDNRVVSATRHEEGGRGGAVFP